MSELSQLSPQPLWDIFAKICSIPHPSYHEEQLAEHIMGWAKEKGFFKTPSEDDPENILFPDLPLNIVSPKCYAASSMFVPETATMHPEVFVRTANWQYFFAKQGSKIKNTKYKIDTTWLRAGQEKYWLMVTPYIDFYFECSDWDKLRQYLKIIKDVGFIGAKRAVGYGMINKIKLFIESEDYSILKDGLPTRPLPVKEFNGKVSKSSPIGISSYYAPYWLAYCCCSPFLSLPCPRHLPKTAPMFCRITA